MSLFGPYLHRWSRVEGIWSASSTRTRMSCSTSSLEKSHSTAAQLTDSFRTAWLTNPVFLDQTSSRYYFPYSSRSSGIESPLSKISLLPLNTNNPHIHLPLQLLLLLLRRHQSQRRLNLRRSRHSDSRPCHEADAKEETGSGGEVFV